MLENTFLHFFSLSLSPFFLATTHTLWVTWLRPGSGIWKGAISRSTVLELLTWVTKKVVVPSTPPPSSQDLCVELLFLFARASVCVPIAIQRRRRSRSFWLYSHVRAICALVELKNAVMPSILYQPYRHRRHLWCLMGPPVDVVFIQKKNNNIFIWQDKRVRMALVVWW